MWVHEISWTFDIRLHVFKVPVLPLVSTGFYQFYWFLSLSNL